ncbi:MAG TPA: FecR domain-containing protein [Opitutaceae bacterium]|nr:FecR domain-containing protein [Opitutaceae bacterium]
MNDQPTADRLDDEAALWAARLDGGGMNDADRSALAAWLNADAMHAEVLAGYRHLSAQIDAGLMVSPRRVSRRRALIALSAIAAAVAVLFAFLSTRPRNFETNAAERHVATLADGSQIELNAQTAIEVDFRRAERHVRLQRGEALFTVAKDASRPFVVETSQGVVRVTGTVFDVRSARDAQIEVTVLKGTVRVRSANAAIGDEVLTPRRQATMTGEQIVVRDLPDDAAENAIAWRQGQAVFVDTPLAEAAERFATYHARSISVDREITDLRLGGRYSLADLDGWLDSVVRVLPVRVLRDPRGGIRIVAETSPAK